MQNYEIISEFFALATRKWRRRGAARATNVKNGNKIASKQRFCDIFRSKDVHEERKAKNMPKKRRTGREYRKFERMAVILPREPSFPTAVPALAVGGGARETVLAC